MSLLMFIVPLHDLLSLIHQLLLQLLELFENVRVNKDLIVFISLLSIFVGFFLLKLSLIT